MNHLKDQLRLQSSRGEGRTVIDPPLRQIRNQCTRIYLTLENWGKLHQAHVVLVWLTQAGRSVEIWLMAFITHTSPDRNHPLALSVAVHTRGGPSLRFTVGHTRSAHRNQGCWLRPRGGRRVGRQVEAGGRALAVENGHAHERNTRAAVNDGQDESETRFQRTTIERRGGLGVGLVIRLSQQGA